MKPVGQVFIVTLVLFASGCATAPYRPGTTLDDPRLATQIPPDVQIERGKPNRVLDAADWVWPGSWLGKLVLWDRRVDNHKIGEEAEAVMQRYLDYNKLAFVKVRLNQYAPRDEFRRLRANHSMGAGWRYTLGVLGWLQYALLPGRIFGGDHYNPYSNTINLYSDIPAIAAHEGGHAKDFADRKWKGFYGIAYAVPFVNLYHEALASNDAIGYLEAYESVALQEEGYRIMHPAYGTYVGGNVGLLFPDQAFTAFTLSVLSGHLSGRENIRDRR
jgi:hypothetical protein